jgi:heme-degrading monooxygenase HmoA
LLFDHETISQLTVPIYLRVISTRWIGFPENEEARMFVVIVNFPPIKEGRDESFRDWFGWSTALLGRHKGFVSRRLLEPIEGGNLAAILEYESREAFTAVERSPDHDEAASRVASLLEGAPRIAFYEVVG